MEQPEKFRVLQEAPCEALCSLHAEMTLQATGGSRDSANGTESHVLMFLRFCQICQVFSVFLRFCWAHWPRATADQQCALRIDVQRQVNFKLTPVQAK